MPSLVASVDHHHHQGEEEQGPPGHCQGPPALHGTDHHHHDGDVHLIRNLVVRFHRDDVMAAEFNADHFRIGSSTAVDDDHGDDQGGGPTSDDGSDVPWDRKGAVVLQHPFRVWGQGEGFDYTVTLTGSGLTLDPVLSRQRGPGAGSTGKYNYEEAPGLCCICPGIRMCSRAKCAGGPCGAKVMHLQAKDMVACYPANHLQTSDTSSSGRSLAAAGYPTFMVIAYPRLAEVDPRRKNDRRRSRNYCRTRMVMQFHAVPGMGEPPIRPMEESGSGGGATSDEDRKAWATAAWAAKLRDTWVHAIRTSLFPLDHGESAFRLDRDGSRLFVVLNPMSGKKQGQLVANRSLFPVLQQAGIEYEVLVTQYPGHAREIVRRYASDRWRGVMVVGGDGTVFEVLNGLYDRPDWREAFKHLTVGTVGAGGGNGLFKSLTYRVAAEANNEPVKTDRKSEELSVAIDCARGSSVPLDLMYVETPMKTAVAFLSLTWGMVADVDLESEGFRWAGEARYTMYAPKLIAERRTYPARISYIEIVEVNRESQGQRQAETDNIIRELQTQAGNQNNDTSSEDSSGSDERAPSVPGGPNKELSFEGKFGEYPGQGAATSGYRILPGAYSPSAVELIDGQFDGRVGQPQPPGTYLVPRHISYGAMLAHGQLYSRSWQELQGKVMTKLNLAQGNDEMWLLEGPMPGPQMSAAAAAAAAVAASCQNCPKHGTNPITSNGFPKTSQLPSPYNIATESLKRANDATRPKFRDLPGIMEPLKGRLEPTASSNGVNRWKVEENDYVGVCVVNVPYISETTKFAPRSRVNDGAMYLVLLRDTLSRGDLMKVLLECETGDHVRIPGVETIPVRAVRIEPKGPEDKMGRYSLDGESMAACPIQMHIMPKAINVYASHRD